MPSTAAGAVGSARVCSRPVCRSVRPSTSAARSASTGWRVISLSDTSRLSAMATLTADSEVPPLSKKWSRRPTCSTGTPSTVAHAAASRCSVGVAGGSTSSSTTSSSAASAVSAFLSILLLAVSGSASRQWKAVGTM